ncbi:MAG: diguanylate cyclase [Acidobacteria bacterium]|nr:diguanylate cyclase [Acidobacteriota bacterium]
MMDSKEVLLISEDPLVSSLLRKSLERAGYHVEACSSLAEGEKRLRQKRFGVVIADEAAASAGDVRKAEGDAEVILLGAEALQAMQSLIPMLRVAVPGAAMGPYRALLSEVLGRVAAGFEKQALLAENGQLRESLRKAEREIERLTLTDGATSLYLKPYFVERLADECIRAHRYHRPLSAFLLEVHWDPSTAETNSLALAEVGTVLLRHLRKTDLRARWSYHEFAVAVVETDLDGASVTAEKLRKVISARGVSCAQGTLTFSAAAGAATLEEGSDENALMAAAESVLRRAQRGAG